MNYFNILMISLLLSAGCANRPPRLSSRPTELSYERPAPAKTQKVETRVENNLIAMTEENAKILLNNVAELRAEIKKWEFLAEELAKRAGVQLK